MSRRLVLCFLVMLIAVPTVFGSAQQEQAETGGGVNMTGLPIVDDKVSISMMAFNIPLNGKPFAEMETVAWAEEQTNIHIDWTEVPQNAWTEKLNLVFASGDYPDAVYRGMTDAMTLDYGLQGVLVPLEEMIPTYAPNVQKVMMDIPAFKSLITAPDGHIYALATGASAPWSDIGWHLHINQDWLDTLGLEKPTTTDEFYDVLMAFKTQDPNGNGEADEIPFTFFNQGLDLLFGAFGVIVEDDYLMVRDGKVLFAGTEPGYKEGIKYFHRLAADGLIDPEGFTQNQSQHNAKTKAEEPYVGVIDIFIPDNHLAPSVIPSYSLLLPIEGPNGDRLWPHRRGIGVSKNGPAITMVNEHPEATLRWFDLFVETKNEVSVYDKIFNMGFEGQGWVWVDEANRQWRSSVENTPEGLSYGQWRGTIAPGAAAYMIDLYINDHRVVDGRAALKLGFVNEYRPYAVPEEDRIPAGYMTAELQQEFSTIATDIQSYADQMKAGWILEGGIDERWDEYLSNLEKMNLERYLEIQQELYDAAWGK
jgi:putative aldouronate transport system substrate-binding protein